MKRTPAPSSTRRCRHQTTPLQSAHVAGTRGTALASHSGAVGEAQVTVSQDLHPGRQQSPAAAGLRGPLSATGSPASPRTSSCPPPPHGDHPHPRPPGVPAPTSSCGPWTLPSAPVLCILRSPVLLPLTPARVPSWVLVPPPELHHPLQQASSRAPCIPAPGAPGILRDPCTTRPHAPFQHGLAKALPSSRTTDGAPARGKEQGGPRLTSPGLQCADRKQAAPGDEGCTVGGQAGRTRGTARWVVRLAGHAAQHGGWSGWQDTRHSPEPFPGADAAPDPPRARQPPLWPRRVQGCIHGDPAAFPWWGPGTVARGP
eukprot:XP_028348381.1 uncharacterized protein LOC114486662 [Physeter catodon]